MSDVREEERPSGLAKKGFNSSYIESWKVRQLGDWYSRTIHTIPGRHRAIDRCCRLRDSQTVNRAFCLIDEVCDVRTPAPSGIARHEMRAELFGAVIE